jgi:NAD(P)-dependent dehydrogenase (short-subunit alcohol dehydrogenase family)
VAASELANTGVAVNAIRPGMVLTPLVWNKLKDRAKALRITVETETRHW